MSPFSPVDVSCLSQYAERQRALLAELGMGVGCATFTMGVLVGVYFLLDSL